LLALHLSRVTGLQVTRRTVEAGLAGRFQAIGVVFPLYLLSYPLVNILTESRAADTAGTGEG
jgi:hypothetical protein